MSNFDYKQHGSNASFQETMEVYPDIIKNKVSKQARSENGFLTKYLEVDGDMKKMDEKLLKKREYFLRRVVPLYVKNPTYKRMLSLYAWSWKPNQKAEPKEKKKRGRKNKKQLPSTQSE